MPAPVMRHSPDEVLEKDQQMLVDMFGLTHAREIRVANVTVNSHLESEDLWMYCTSRKYDTALFDDFSADACVRIDNPFAFYRAITRALADLVTWNHTGPCVYGERVHPMHLPDRVPIYFLKELKHSTQAEHRGVWRPSEHPISRRLLTWPELTIFCAPHNDDAPRPPQAGVLFEGRIFEDMELQLDDLIFVDCTFRRCRLVYGGGLFEVLNPRYEDTQLTLVHGAAAGIGLLHSILSNSKTPSELLAELQACVVLPQRPKDVFIPYDTTTEEARRP